jgi:hypothetical protein
VKKLEKQDFFIRKLLKTRGAKKPVSIFSQLHKECASNCQLGSCGRRMSGGADMFARAVIINVKPGCDFPRARIYPAMDRVRDSEGSPAGARSSAISAELLSVRENP